MNRSKSRSIVNLAINVINIASIGSKKQKSAYRRVMDKVHMIEKDFSTILKLIGYMMTLYLTLKALGVI